MGCPCRAGAIHFTTMTTTEPSATPSDPLSMDWAGLLDSCRKTRGKFSSLTFGAIQEEFHLPEVTTVIEQYSAIADKEGSYDDIDESKRAGRKEQILAVRNALRYAISCLSLGSSQVQTPNKDDVDGDGNSIRHQIQQEAVVGCSLHKGLARALQCRNMDSKSQLLAARLLSNLVTGNAVTSNVVLKDIAPSSTEEYRTKQLLASMSLSGSNDADGSEDRQWPDESIEYNWADMIVCAARSGDTGREIVAAIVAAIFNAAVAINEDQDYSSPIVERIASDKVLSCACVRHILPADTIKRDEGKDNEQVGGAGGDDATEWISLFLSKLSCYGHFSSMYKATGVNRENDASTPNDENSSIFPTVTPEQIVLLHCIASALDEWTTDTSSTAVECPLGGASGQQTIIKSCHFLANEAKFLRETIRGGERSAEAYAGERACRLSAYLSILEMLATLLSSDDSSKAKDHIFCRIFLGKETTLLSDVVMELGVLVDELSVANRGVKARELKINSHDQRLAVACVRLIGNICYKCPSNQDKVRETEVPFPGSMPAKVADGTAVVRCGLHVLLSCTSFSYGCFTLREWALVAIRNVLDGNQQNQDMVAQLEAQKTVDTPELNKMGVKTVIDDQGKVRVEPRG